MLHALSSAACYCTSISGLKRNVLLQLTPVFLYLNILLVAWMKYSPFHEACEDCFFQMSCCMF